MKFLYSKNPKFLQNLILGDLNPVKKPPVFSLYGGWKKLGFTEDLGVKKKLKCQSRNLVCAQNTRIHVMLSTSHKPEKFLHLLFIAGSIIKIFLTSNANTEQKSLLDVQTKSEY
jgi:hypothetical protein